MKRKGMVILATVAALIFTSCGKKVDPASIVKKVKTYTIKISDQNSMISFVGNVVPHRESILAFKIAGPIKNIPVREGNAVKKDDILAEMDMRDYNVNIEAIKNKYLAAQAQAKNARAQFSRVNTMYKANATPRKVYDEVSAQMNMAAAQEKMAYQEYTDAKNKLEDTALKAPYDGIITQKYVDEGTVVNAGTPILGIMTNEDLEVSISASLNDIEDLKNAQNIKFIFNNKEYMMKILDISQKTGITRAAYPVRLGFVDKVELMPGTNGKVSVVKNNNKDKISIPLSSLFNDDKNTKVWIFDGEKVNARIVKVEGIDDDGNAIVVAGLKDGETIVEAGVDYLSEGEKVGVVPEFTDTNIGKIL